VTTLLDPAAEEAAEHELLARARRAGFCLFQCETETGQVVWEWRRSDEPRPRFLTRRLALDWMRTILESTTRVP
jgi:hypothetical protein